MDLELAGYRALISGGSRGIGRGIAAAFLAEKMRVAIIARGEAGLKETAAGLGGDVVAISADVTSQHEIERAYDVAEKSLGAVDVVVANVGGGASMAGSAVPQAEWERVMNLNFISAASLASVAAGRLPKNGRGSLILISSIAGLEALGAPAPYAAAKAALQALVKSYARDLGEVGIRVNAVAPGNIMFSGGTWDGKQKEDSNGVEAMLAREVPLGRFGTPREIGDVVTFLCSKRASFITGETIVVDGGQTRTIG